MGFWDRVEKIATMRPDELGEAVVESSQGRRVGRILTGFGGALQSPFGLIKDFAVAPFRDEEDFDGFWNTIKSRGVHRGGQALENLFGPDEGFGALIGGLPDEQVRQPVSKLFEGLETVYREGVSEPIQTLQYVNAATDPLNGGGPGALFDRDTWSEGRELANSGEMSPGRNFAAGVYGADITDPESRAEVTDDRGFGALSGSIDGALRWFADPTVVVAKGAMVARSKLVTKPIDGKTDFDQVTGTSRFAKFNNALEGKSASEIRDQFFPSDVNGAALASALAEAGDATTRARILRLGMGDRKQLDALYAERADLAGRIERLIDDQALLRSLDDDNFARANRRRRRRTRGGVDVRDPNAGMLDEDVGATAALDSEVGRLEAETNKLYTLEERNLRNEAVFGQIRAVPRYRRLDEARVAVTRSQFYQHSPFAAPVRTTFNMRPPRLLDLNKPDGDIAVTQYLRKAGMDKAEQDEWRTQYMAIPSPEGRNAIVTQMEDAAIARIAQESGLSRAELDRVMTSVNKGRNGAQQMLKSRTFDGEGRSRISFKDDATGELHEYPLLVTQTANLAVLGDIGKAREAAKRIAEHKRRFGPSMEVPEDLLNNFTQYWKASVLLRIGWPIRMVTDEQMRIMGKLGVMAQLRNIGPGIANKAYNELSRATAIATRGFDENGERISVEEAVAAAPQSKIGFGREQIGEYDIPKIFGEDVNNPTAAFNYTASNPAFERLFKDAEAQELNRLRREVSDYRSVSPTADPDDYGSAWLDAVNQQIGRDSLARIFLQGGDVQDAVRWLRTPEGRRHQASLPERRRDLEGWAGAVQDQVESYTLGNRAIMQAALKQQASLDDLFRIAPDASARPIVHGGVLQDAMGSGPAARMLGGFVQKAYTALGSVPSDTLSRHPFADAMYRAEANRLVELLDVQARKEGRRLTADDLEIVKKRSTEYAVAQTRHLLYDFSERSDLAHMMRFMSPFFSAWQETMTRWAGIAVENPAYAARLRMLWSAPEKAGIVTDENGNAIGLGMKEGQKVKYPDGTVGIIGKERLITVPVPPWAKDVLGMKGLKTQGEVTFNKKSFNMILQGNPGVGLPVQMPMNLIVKERPELADAMRFVLPFGPNESTWQMLMPATAKRLFSRAAGEEDVAFRNSALRIYFDRATDYNLGKIEDPPTWAQAIEDTKAFYNVRAVASFVSPAAPGFRSPYQPYIDAYYRLRQENIETADQRFLDLYGAEFFPLTASFTKSADGVPPTVEGFKARSKYKDLIEKSPELGGLIVGEEGAGEFSSAIYQSQKANRVKPGSMTNQRYSLSFEEAASQPNVRLGWMEYRKVSDLIEAERIERGLPNLQVKAAEDLAEIKRQMVDKLAERYPEWYEAFGTVDRNAMGRRLVALRAIAYDPRMEGRPDMRGVRQYFDVRAAVKKELVEREKAGGSGTLTSAANQDLGLIWDTLVSKIVEQNLAFSDTYFRYLERDDLSAD
jgi:hypothetical protein